MTALVDLYTTNKDHGALLQWIRVTYGIGNDPNTKHLNPERLRREELARRIRLYRDDAQKDFETLIDQTFDDEKVKADRRKLIRVASEQNVTRRIVDEVASLYDRPAVRTLLARNDEFHAEEKRMRLHQVMQEAHRLTYLCNEVLVWQFKSIDDKAKLRVITPDSFDAVPDPRDKLEAAGFLIDMSPITILTGSQREALPHYELWDDTYRYLLSATGQLVDEQGGPVATPIEHGLKRIPGVLFHRRLPSEVLLDPRHGRDIESGHLGIALLNVMIMRLSKSQGERQPYVQGNLAALAAGQRMDGETPLALPPDTSIGMLDSRTDSTHYLDVKKDKLSNLCSTYGISYEQYTLTESVSTTSGKGYLVRREKLTELRGEQRGRALDHEYLVVALMGFEPEGMKVDHREQAMPQDATEEIALLEMKLPLGLDNQIDYLKRKDPDLDDKQAQVAFERNLRLWSALIRMVRALNMPADATGTNPGNDPTINGAGKITEKLSATGLNGSKVNPASGATTQTHPATGTATAA